MRQSNKLNTIQSLRNEISRLEGSDHLGFQDTNQNQFPDDIVDSGGKSYEKAMSRILRWSSYRERSTKEIRDKLEAEDFDQAVIEEALDRALEAGIVDDRRFADSMIRSKISAGKGRARIMRDLRRKGISDPMAESLLDEYLSDGEGEYQRAKDYLKKHPSRSKNIREGAYRKLVSQGFSAEIASKIAKEWTDGSY